MPGALVNPRRAAYPLGVSLSVSLPLPATNLPAERDRMVGRQEEIERLDEVLRSGARLVTLTGPPGVGKTRLALHLGQLWRMVGEKVIWAPLSGRTERDDVVDAVIRGLGVSISHDGPPEDVAGRVESVLLGQGPVLLLLDGADELADEARAVLDGWLDVTDELRILATARGWLESGHEQAFPVSTLPIPDAVALFEARARRARPGFSAQDEATRRIVEDVVYHLDGLPLGIELAAARTAVMPIEMLRTRLASAVTLGSAGIDTRHTLSDAILASWRHLAAAEQAALVQCSVFEDGFDLEAAESVLRLPDGVAAIEAIEGLQRASLVVTEQQLGRVRFHLLRTIRGFAQRRLDSEGKDSAVLDRFVLCMQRRGQDLAGGRRGPSAVGIAAALADEQENLAKAARIAAERDPAAAARIVLALEPFVVSRWPIGRYVALVAKVAESLDAAAHPDLAARLHLSHGRAARLHGDRETASRALANALERVGRADEIRASVLAERGLLARGEGRLREALGDLEAALDIARVASAEHLVGYVHELLAPLHALDGDDGAALRHAASAVRVHERLRDAASVASASSTLGAVLLGLGRVDEAAAHLTHALELFDTVGDAAGGARARVRLGLVELERGRTARARTWLEPALETHRRLGLFEGLGDCHAALGAVELASGDVRAAEQHLREALDAHRDTSERGCAHDLAVLGRVDVAAGRAELGRRRIEEAIEALEALGGDRARVDTYRVLLAEAVATAEAPAAATRGPSLEVDRRGAWFRVDGGEVFELGSRSPGRALLVEMARRLVDSPATGLETEEVFAVGWPGERALEESRRNRVYVTIRRLRAAGLGELLQSDERGYYLDPAIQLSWFPRDEGG